jgi:hypothetical protein
MGDRSNIVIKDGDHRVWLYGHWMGARSIGHAVHGLRSGRVHDAHYLARIVLCSMIGPDIEGEIGYGISATMLDNQHPIIVLDVGRTATSVWFEDSDGRQVSPVFTPDEFIALAEVSSWDECDPFDLNCDHDAHEWPFAPFLSLDADATAGS